MANPAATSNPPADALPAACPASLRQSAFEVVWIFLIFFLFAGTPPPDVGESHYLPKALHYWQPQWCAGDLFLESKDAHGSFYWAFGWLTPYVSLTTAAWIGRVVTWGLLAWSWRRLSWAIVPRPLFSLLSAGLMLLFARHFHLAGEWIVGGVEAKGFAYVLVFLALEAVVRDRWRAALLLAGAAGAFHVLVGGWTAVAIGLAWLVAGRQRVGMLKIAPAAIGGLLLALPGLVPAIGMNAGVPSEIQRDAARIYVFERLSHHLVFHRFPLWHQVRYALLLLAWLQLAWSARGDLGQRRLQLVVAGAVGIALVGVVIDQGFVLWGQARSQSPEQFQLSVAPLLRYYWFRLADSLVPIGVSLAFAWWMGQWQASRPHLASWLLIGAMAAAGLNIGEICYRRSVQRLPGAIRQPGPAATAELPKWNRDWQAACQWIREQAPPDARFLTPRAQQTFKWYAQRPEVANWKDVPQDARAIVAWKAALNDLYPRDLPHRRHDLAAFSDDELVALARKYGATHILMARSPLRRTIALPRVYPTFREENPSFEIYRVPFDSSRAAP